MHANTAQTLQCGGMTSVPCKPIAASNILAAVVACQALMSRSFGNLEKLPSQLIAFARCIKIPSTPRTRCCLSAISHALRLAPHASQKLFARSHRFSARELLSSQHGPRSLPGSQLPSMSRLSGDKKVAVCAILERLYNRRSNIVAANEELVAKIQSEISMEEDMKEDDDLSANIKEYLENSPFEVRHRSAVLYSRPLTLHSLRTRPATRKSS